MSYDAVAIWSRVNGLANRLQGIAAAALLAEQNNCPCLVAWNKDSACPGWIGDVFDPASFFWTPVNASVLSELKDRYTNPFLVSNFADTVDATRWAKWLKMGGLAARYTAMTRFCPRLKPSAAVAALLDELEAVLPSRIDRIGVHIRRTDRQPWLHAAKDERLVARLDALAEQFPDATFVVAADNPASVAMMLDRYGVRAKHTGVRWHGGERPPLRLTTLTDTALDLFAMTRCSRLVGTDSSTFSNLASWMAGVPTELA